MFLGRQVVKHLSGDFETVFIAGRLYYVMSTSKYDTKKNIVTVSCAAQSDRSIAFASRHSSLITRHLSLVTRCLPMAALRRYVAALDERIHNILATTISCVFELAICDQELTVVLRTGGLSYYHCSTPDSYIDVLLYIRANPLVVLHYCTVCTV